MEPKFVRFCDLVVSKIVFAEQVHSGVEGDIQGADREVQAAPPAEERDGDPNESPTS